MYSIDTSALIDGWVRYYRPTAFPGLWEKMGDLASGGQLVASRSVYHEIEDREDRLVDWAREHVEMFVEDDEVVQAQVRGIFNGWPRQVDFTRYVTGADAFVIAHAQGREFAVVTGEKPSNNPDCPKIPDVCSHYGVRCINLIDMIEERGWRF